MSYSWLFAFTGLVPSVFIVISSSRLHYSKSRSFIMVLSFFYMNVGLELHVLPYSGV